MAIIAMQWQQHGTAHTVSTHSQPGHSRSRKTNGLEMPGAYTEAVAAAAAQHEDFVVGFISVSPAQWSGPAPSPGLIHMTPGVQLQVGTLSLHLSWRHDTVHVAVAACTAPVHHLP
jgi:Orotidine 5'-phosphate decarboxylase / HUMPS family